MRSLRLQWCLEAGQASGPSGTSTPLGLFIAVHIPSRHSPPTGAAAKPHSRPLLVPQLTLPTPAVPGVLVGDQRRFEISQVLPHLPPQLGVPAGGCMHVGFQSGPLGRGVH